MIFYEIVLHSVPKFLFACRVTVDKYRNQFPRRADYLEIAYCEEGRICYEHVDGREELSVPGMLIPVFADAEMKTVAFQNERQRHSTVGVQVQYDWKCYASERECNVQELRNRMKQETILLIPYHEPILEKAEEIRERVEAIARTCHSESSAERMQAIAEWFSLAGMLTEFVLEKLDNTKSECSPTEREYAEQAVQIIHGRYAEHLSVQEIARQIGISEGYLHRIFQKRYRCGVTEYCNHYRVQVAIRLTESRNLSLKEAAYQVGIEDPAYMSRLFRKVTGRSFRAYFRE